MRYRDEKFERIACADNINLTNDAYARLASLSIQPFNSCSSDPKTESELFERIDGADCVLVSWRTPMDESLLARCHNLKYIGLCASKYSNPSAANINLAQAQNSGISVTGVGAYGDEATAEFIFCTLLNLCRGFGQAQWKNFPCELHGKRLGIIGMGAMGSHVLRLAQGFGMVVSYFSRTRKPEYESAGVCYLEKSELLKQMDIISLHVPKGTTILNRADFDCMGEETVLINTCLGTVFSIADFEAWIKLPARFAIMDESADQAYRIFRGKPNVIYPKVVAGKTSESKARLSNQVIANLESFLAGTPQNIIKTS
jgi:lactate dehydrogenase-like 2-hydroxyacid dehydrogenase